jgi:hypothetical protein
VKLTQLPSAIVAYTQPRPSKVAPGTDTSGNIPPPRRAKEVDQLANGGAMSGGIQGLISGSMLGGVPGALTGGVAGAVGGLVGTKVGFKYRSFALAQTAGGLTGAAAAAGMYAATSAVFQQPIDNIALTGFAAMGAMTGIVGTLGGSRDAITRDGVYGGYLAGMAASQYVANPLLSLAGAAGAGLGGRAETRVGRLALAGVAGAALGALSCVPFAVAGHPEIGQLILHSMAGGAAAAAAGSMLGPGTRQVMRNAQDDMVSGINRKLDPILEKYPPTTEVKVAAGAALGALTLGSLGLVAPTLGVGLGTALAVSGTVGATIGGVKTYQAVRYREKVKVAQAVLEELGAAAPGISHALKGLPPIPAKA